MNYHVQKLAIDVFGGDEDAALKWLHTSNSEFGYKTPIEFSQNLVGHNKVINHLLYLHEQTKVKKELYM